ncbi:GNAT family N-acetyltransferase [Clostridium peptidivorans]|uniref:GNAT family N-acetyltransferase n=1 Tax=Clostridium peptidivorans TaxID=100174 RepID=UPI000BE2B6FE|nr:GNAT family N-acetyltransferase [Clostridium peptidivorans]
MINIKLENHYNIRSISIDDIKIMKSLCERCLDYYLLQNAAPPSKEDAEEIFTELPPGKNYEDKFVLGLFNHNDQLIGIIDIVKNFPTLGQWMLGLLLIDPNERCNGLGRIVHNALVKWTIDSGATSLRIGVLEENINGINFWSNVGYTKIKEVSIDFTNKTHKVHVMTLQV